MVRMFGVRCRARSAGTTRRAPDLTQSWSLDVNTGNHRARTGTLARHAIHIENLVDHVVPVVQLRLGKAAARSSPCAASGSSSNAPSAAAHSFGCRGGTSTPSTSCADDAAEAGDGRCDHRHATGHRLEQHDAEALTAGCRRAEDVGRRVVPRQQLRRDPARELDVGDAHRRDLTLVSPAHRPVADDHEARVLRERGAAGRTPRATSAAPCATRAGRRRGSSPCPACAARRAVGGRD